MARRGTIRWCRAFMLLPVSVSQGMVQSATRRAFLVSIPVNNGYTLSVNKGQSPPRSRPCSPPPSRSGIGGLLPSAAPSYATAAVANAPSSAKSSLAVQGGKKKPPDNKEILTSRKDALAKPTQETGAQPKEYSVKCMFAGMTTGENAGWYASTRRNLLKDGFAATYA